MGNGNFIFPEKNWKTVKKDVSNPGAQVISDEEIIAVGKLVKSVEQYYGSPQDTEWAIDETGKLFLLQARPITALG